MVAHASSYRGLVDTFREGRASGWAVDLENASKPRLHILIDGQEIATVETGLPRPELKGLVASQDGLIGFTYDIPPIFRDGLAHRLSFRFPDRSAMLIVQTDDPKDLREDVLFTLSDAPSFKGYLEGIRGGALQGWALAYGSDGRGRGQQTISITIDGSPFKRAKADQFRGDVGESLGADGLCGFSVPIPALYRDGKPHVYDVTIEPSGATLTNSPLRTSIADDRLEAELMDMTATIDRLHRDLSALRLKIRDIMPRTGRKLADYDHWAREYYARLREYVALNRQRSPLKHEPLVSILCPVYRPVMTDFVQAVQSVLAQGYANWELILIDDGAADTRVTRQIEAWCAADKRIRAVTLAQNCGIAEATNAGLRTAKGAYVAFFDHDDELVDVALEVMVRAAQTTGARLLYSDEDKIDHHGRFRDPNLKPDFSYRYLLGCNYICHLTMMELSLTQEVGEFRDKYNGAQDHDYILRAVECLDQRDIHHVPEILYHWRITQNSTAATIENKRYAVAAGVDAVTDHLSRRGMKARPESIDQLTIYRMRWQYRTSPRVCLVIPFKDEVEMTRQCVESLFQQTNYAAFEIILIDNWSVSREAAAFTQEVSSNPRVTVLRVEEEFNFSRLNNFAVKHTDAPFILFMNNDVIIRQADWLRLMVQECLAEKDVAIVGNTLLYDDDTIQHAGVVVGPDVIGAHAFKRVGSRDKGYIGRIALTHEVSAVTAACMLIRREAFVSVGGFDEENLPVAYNDVDLCLKIRSAGHRILFCAESRSDHLESRSRGSDDRPQHETRFFLESQFMRQKWAGQAVFENDPFYSKFFRTDAVLFDDLRDPQVLFDSDPIFTEPGPKV